MRVLLVSALFPPKMLGGAENSAANLAAWLVKQGVTVGVIRATDADEPEGEEINDAGVHIWRVKTMHLYPPYTFPQQPAWKKPIYHLQDHFDPRIRKRVGDVLDAFCPDLINIHMIQGIGYPILSEFAKRRIPVNYVLPDLGLACIRMNMFKGGKDCESHCQSCRISRDWKLRLIREIPRLSFISPSRANLETLSKFFPVKDYPNTVILNPNAYPMPRPENQRQESQKLRILFAGRIHPSKGVNMLIEAVSALQAEHDISLTIAGRGSEEEKLRSRYGSESWCRFLGFISQQDLADEMVQSDLFCIPSIWAENSPGVVIQALGLGLPVLGSARGGIPELVSDGINGRIVSEQTVEAWANALRKIISGEDDLAQWRENATATAVEFTQDGLGRKVLAWMEDVIKGV